MRIIIALTLVWLVEMLHIRYINGIALVNSNITL